MTIFTSQPMMTRMGAQVWKTDGPNNEDVACDVSSGAASPLDPSDLTVCSTKPVYWKRSLDEWWLSVWHQSRSCRYQRGKRAIWSVWVYRVWYLRFLILHREKLILVSDIHEGFDSSSLANFIKRKMLLFFPQTTVFWKRALGSQVWKKHCSSLVRH